MENDTQVLFLTFLLICMFVSGSVESVQQQHSVPGEYIVHLREHSAEDIPTLVPDSHVIRVYSIGSEKFALIRTDKREFGHKIANMTLHPNRLFYTMSDQRIVVDEEYDCACDRQYTGSKIWGLTRISSRSLPNFFLWDSYLYNDNGRNVTVFVMDSGVNVNHETFGGRARVGYTVQDLLKIEEDFNGHGTAVASVIAGSKHGSAKQASIVSVKITSDGSVSESNLLEGLDWISKAISESSGERFVINLSLSSLRPGNTSCSADLLCKALDEMNAVVVVAAGNDDGSGERLDSCDLVPARFPNVISVAATTKYDKLWERTSRGPCVDMLAPGHEILAASHMDITSEEKKTGSSLAAPIVAGVVARHLENYNYQPSTQYMLKLLKDNATRGKTNAQDYNTPDYLVYKGCPEWCRGHSNVIRIVIISVVPLVCAILIVVAFVYIIKRRCNRESIPDDEARLIRSKTELIPLSPQSNALHQ